jgi:hypothetical protein
MFNMLDPMPVPHVQRTPMIEEKTAKSSTGRKGEEER